MHFTSTLVNGGPLGSTFAGIMGDITAPSQSIKYVFDTPRDINGTYDFTYNLIDPESIFFHLVLHQMLAIQLQNPLRVEWLVS